MIKIRNKNNFKNGSVSLISVMFAVIVMSLIVLSFIRQMNSGLAQNVMYTTSQAAFDSALTGVMDTQLALGECKRNPGTSGARYEACRRILDGSNNCSQNITDIATVIGITAGVVDSASNQKYTCITIQATTKSYQGLLTSGTSDDGVVIPLNTAGNAKYALLTYGTNFSEPFSQDNWDCLWSGNTGCTSFTSTVTSGDYSLDITRLNRANEQRSGKNFMPLFISSSSDYYPTLGFELSQIPANFNVNHLSDNNGGTTNVGYLMLSPYPLTHTQNAVPTAPLTIENKLNGGVMIGLAGSADKAAQAPAPVYCGGGSGAWDDAPKYPSVTATNRNYNCATLIELPNPRNGSDGSRNKDYSFVRLTMPSIESSVGIPFEISFYENKPNALSVSDMQNKALTFSETQYLISVQGQTGERIRRIQANLGGIENSAIVPLWSAAVGGTSGVSKCNNGSCDDNNTTNNMLQYTTTDTTTTKEAWCSVDTSDLTGSILPWDLQNPTGKCSELIDGVIYPNP